jgi:tripartite-type tricarboxylate transporter receptor subunit TctC
VKKSIDIRRVIVGRALTVAIVICAAGNAAAADTAAYPTKPVRIVIGALPGSNTDFFFRVISTAMGNALGQQLIADYRAGGGGLVGAAATSKAAPDGYTISMVGSGFVMHPALMKSMPYDALKDFTAVGLVVESPQVLVIHPSLPVKNVKELVALARMRPGQLNFGSSGPGTNTHLAGVLFNLLGKVNIVHVPYKSTPPMMIDVIAGQIEMAYPSIPGALEHAKSGRMRMLAQTGKMRSASATDVPTMQEAGLPGFYITSGFGLMGPAGLPRAMVDRLNAAMVQAVRLPASQKLFIENGVDAVGSTPEEYDAFNRSEIARWIKVAREGGINPE